MGSLQGLHEAGKDLPRFLFRGFHSGSGSWAGLNTKSAILPHAFAPHLKPIPGRWPRKRGGSVDVALPDIDDLDFKQLQQFAEGHIYHHVETWDPLTPFSSWGDSSTALFFALGTYEGHGEPWNMSAVNSYICVLDVHMFLSESERGRKIFHAPSLGWKELYMEYLIFGPVSGPALRCVSITSIREEIKCPSWPFCPTLARTTHLVTPDEVRDAVLIGRLFQTAADPDVDITLAVAASVLAWQQMDVSSPDTLHATEFSELIEKAPEDVKWCDENIDTIKSALLLAPLPPLSQRPLANPRMPTTLSPQLQLVKHLLLTLQANEGPRISSDLWLNVFFNKHGATSRHKCPETRVCHYCKEKEGKSGGVVLTPCEYCQKRLYCSATCRYRDSHSLVCNSVRQSQ